MLHGKLLLPLNRREIGRLIAVLLLLLLLHQELVLLLLLQLLQLQPPHLQSAHHGLPSGLGAPHVQLSQIRSPCSPANRSDQEGLPGLARVEMRK